MHALKITVTGLGYVGTSQAVLLAQKHSVTATDLNEQRVKMINKKISPVQDDELEEYLKTCQLDLKATIDPAQAYYEADFVIVAVPTDFDESSGQFDTSLVEDVICTIRKHNRTAFIVIKSTVPVGYTASLREKFGDSRIMFSPEFLRETRALYDNLYPSRIIVGTDMENNAMKTAATIFADLLQRAALKPDVEIFLMDFAEAEAVKLFSNAYLAMRVSFFNEVDSFAATKGLNTRNLINGICADSRIGAHYNNPSFGYGGYCLPKDTKQLLKQFAGVPERLMSSIVESNAVRKIFVTNQVLDKAGAISNGSPTIGIYRLIMKAGSDDFRFSAVQDIMLNLIETGANIMIYEPFADDDHFVINGSFAIPVVQNLQEFKQRCDVIIANRYDTELYDVEDKVYTRDVFMRD